MGQSIPGRLPWERGRPARIIWRAGRPRSQGIIPSPPAAAGTAGRAVGRASPGAPRTCAGEWLAPAIEPDRGRGASGEAAGLAGRHGLRWLRRLVRPAEVLVQDRFPVADHAYPQVAVRPARGHPLLLVEEGLLSFLGPGHVPPHELPRLRPGRDSVPL